MLLEKAGDDGATGFTDIADAAIYHETAKQIFDAARAAMQLTNSNKNDRGWKLTREISGS